MRTQSVIITRAYSSRRSASIVFSYIRIASGRAVELAPERAELGRNSSRPGPPNGTLPLRTHYAAICIQQHQRKSHTLESESQVVILKLIISGLHCWSYDYHRQCGREFIQICAHHRSPHITVQYRKLYFGVL